jgi:nicotinate-nucleotide--dimethylbenzimidazole phosphoribosyltransferase
MNLIEVLNRRRDTRHFLTEEISDDIIIKGIEYANNAPSVGQTKPTRYYIIKSKELKNKIKTNFDIVNQTVITSKQNANPYLYTNLKLEGILEAPVGIVICCDLSLIESFSIGTVTQAREMLIASTVCSIHTFWLYLTSLNLSLGWVSILDFEKLKSDLDIDSNYFPLGYFCIGKPATDYNGEPMLTKVNWNTHKIEPEIYYK